MWTPAVGGSAFAAAHRDGILDSERARMAFGTNAAERALDVWNEHADTFAALERATHAYAHGDFWTRNVLAPHDERVPSVAIDWSELGIAPLAHDIVNFVLDSVWMFDVPTERLPALERAALDGYADGWQEGAASDARAEIAFAYRANARLRMGTLAGPLLAQSFDERKHDEIAARYGRSFDEMFETRAAVIRAALSSP
jgi:Ser/Thr protein kinase RdoA (MazF antagonist)